MAPQYLYNHLLFVYEQTREGGSGNNQPALNKSRVEAMVFPVAPQTEQVIICEAVEKILSELGSIQELKSVATSSLDLLDQSILSKAFKGELVSQDPNDEPASELLARIHAAREKEAAEKKATRKKKSKKKAVPKRKS